MACAIAVTGWYLAHIGVVTQEERVQYAAIIDGILAVSDLSVVSEKKIRKGLEEKLGRDLTDLKVSHGTVLLYKAIWENTNT